MIQCLLRPQPVVPLHLPFDAVGGGLPDRSGSSDGLHFLRDGEDSSGPVDDGVAEVFRPSLREDSAFELTRFRLGFAWNPKTPQMTVRRIAEGRTSAC